MRGERDALWRSGRCHWGEHRWAAAAVAFRRVLAMAPAWAVAHFDLAATLLAQEDREGALASFLRAAALAPNFAEVHARIGYLRFTLGREDAAAALRRAAILDPAVSDVFLHLGAVAYNRGAFGVATALFARAAILRPEHAEAQFRWGMALYRSGAFADATGPLARAAALRPGWGEAHYHLGLALMRMNTSPAARKERATAPCLEGERVVVSLAEPADAPGLLAFHQRNREHLRAWHPGNPNDRLSLAGWQDWTEAAGRLFTAGDALRLVVRLKGQAGLPDLIGEINGRIEAGPIRACTIGYHIDAAQEGKGLMREALRLALGYLFDRFGVRRAVAFHDPENHRSAALLHRLGFREVGCFRRYLLVDGVWRDQVVVDLPAPFAAD